MQKLVEKLMKEGVLKNSNVIGAFLANDRKYFIPTELQSEVYVDAPLPIGQGQTISQPYTVAFMIELLDPRPSQKILDVGFGSGWTTALLAKIVGKAGRVYGLEIVPEVFEFGKRNLAQFAYSNIELYNQSGWAGLSEAAPFDRILVSAGAAEMPEALKKQLKVGGRLVIPIGGGAAFYGQAIRLIKKLGEDRFEEQDYPGFAFVPLVKK